jgi:hypothetical protein
MTEARPGHGVVMSLLCCQGFLKDHRFSGNSLFSEK